MTEYGRACLQHTRWGECCCICDHQFKLKPFWDGGERGFRGWVCLLPILIEESREVCGSSTEHGLCEMFTPRKEIKQ